MRAFLVLLILALSCASEKAEKSLEVQETLSPQEQNEIYAQDSRNWLINKSRRDQEEAKNNRLKVTQTKALIAYDPKTIIKIRKAASKGDREYQYSMGMCYKYGIGVKENLNKSLYWFKKAADQGHMQAKHVYQHMVRRRP